MTQPTFGIFRAIEDCCEEEYLEHHNEELYEGDEDESITMEQFEALVAEYKLEDTDLVYEDDPTDVMVIRHIPTGTFWKGEHFHDSWGGSGSFAEAYTDRPYQVVSKEVLVTQWVEVDEV